jgi:4-hydroxythreonine-4-phosphate dehydrogenase
MKPTIVITMGDFNGIGPEVALKSILSPAIQRQCNPILIGSMDIFAHYAESMRLNIVLKEIEQVPKLFREKVIPVIDIKKFHKPIIKAGTLSKTAGEFAGISIEKAADLCLKKTIDGIVTAPVSKASLHLSGFNYPGQTEMLVDLFSAPDATMMLVAKTFRVGLATIHTPINGISKQLSSSLIARKLQTIHLSLKKDFAIRSPKIAVLGLNPHAGEQGNIGHEEKKFIEPAIRSAKRKGIQAEGPFSADGFFGTHYYKQFDAVFAMYHDQGLIPLKMQGFNIGVNYSAGLPFVRTSPDHGTAFDIAGKNIADPTSMIEAIKLAVKIINNRKRSSH